jgi:hypothetical protein
MEKRILLESGKQKELIETAKNKLNFNWKRLARKLNTGDGYLRNELRKEKRIISESFYYKLCSLINQNYDDFIKEKIDSNWGQIKGGKSVRVRKNLFKEKTPKILCETSDNLAEIIGITIGDGSIYTIPNKSIFQVFIGGNIKNEKQYLLGYIKPLFEKVFKLKMNTKINGNEFFVWKQSKDLVYTLNYYGLPSGNKKKNNISIPNWIMNDTNFLKACIRGIVDTDGCLYPKNKTNRYPTIWISSAIPNLRKSITLAFNELGINLSRWKESRNDAYIDRKVDVIKYYNEIKFNNTKHLIRWRRFMPLSSSPVN